MNRYNIDPYKALKSILEVTSPHLGKEFLKIVCEELKTLFAADTVFITEAIDYNPTTQVKILYTTDASLPDEFDLVGTPCELVYKDEIIQITKDVNINFEKEKKTNLQSFYGIPIHNNENTCIGHIAIFSENQREIPKEIEDIALIFTRRIETEYERILLEAQNEKILKQLYELSIKDSLTKLYNRRYFTQKCSEVFSQVKRDAMNATLIFLDLDNFKHINDYYGHETGDVILEEVGSMFEKTARKDIDFISRIGGEEFAIISLDTSIKSATTLCQRIMKDTNSIFENKPYDVTFSIGIAMFKKEYNSWQDVYNLADKKMYEAKKNGKNRIIG